MKRGENAFLGRNSKSWPFDSHFSDQIWLTSKCVAKMCRKTEKSVPWAAMRHVTQMLGAINVLQTTGNNSSFNDFIVRSLIGC